MAAMTAREFNQYTGKAKLLADEEPVFITERGTVRYVLLNIDEYQTLAKPRRTLSDLLEMDENDYDPNLDFDQYLPERTIDERDLREWWVD
ncbi:MAG: type II toxin-antitoxin system Phd/YefM family antitoxin [Coriobacteriales bacterium]|nr:type II toxin-antitoxin system Phd/YefM family antitoxin [Coriobacteriales bacterium]